ncbi:MAG TPA: allophanate hydrolase [Gammaproteobacteria bacterium]|nr:allophanate hydrolase [Gammaproteobacteria bacterium]
MSSGNIGNLDIGSLRAAYLSGKYEAVSFIRGLLGKIRAGDPHRAWIYVLNEAEIKPYLERLHQSSIEELPLYGIPFAVKDNIDIHGVPTTAACPELSYPPAASSKVVDKLIAAGAVPLGKTNLDQFATGLVGVRSPYGACRNSFNPEYISGGSSSGSAVAVALGQVSFALGTDTSGSGRVPAAFNNLIGLKPSCGALSNSGMFPACKSLDSLSLLTLNAADAAFLLKLTAGFDRDDPYSKEIRFKPPLSKGRIVVGIPKSEQLLFFGNREYERLFDATIASLQDLGYEVAEVDISPLLEAGALLYEGPWIAERAIALEKVLRDCPESVLPVTRSIVELGRLPAAMEAFRAQYRLRRYQRMAQALFSQYDLLMTPTAGTIYRISEVESDPVNLNNRLGYYTNFVNLLDLCAVSVPAGFQTDGLPFGVTLCATAGSDYHLLQVAERLQAVRTGFAGVGQRLNKASVVVPELPSVKLAVCGAHQSSQPLNHQLLELNATLVESTITAPRYRLYVLPGGPPFRPGLVRDMTAGNAIEVEVWSVPVEQVGAFIRQIPAPLGIGRIELVSGEWVSGFICEGYAVLQAKEITKLGSWRRFIEQPGKAEFHAT